MRGQILNQARPAHSPPDARPPAYNAGPPPPSPEAVLVSHRKQFIYTKTVKTAGTSVEAYFEPWCLPPGAPAPVEHRAAHEGPEGIIGYRGADPGDAAWVNHMPAAEIRERLGEELWASYFKFCVVRDPFDMLVSLYHFEVSKGKVRAAQGQDVVAAFGGWLAMGIPVPGRAQYMIDGEFCLDHYLRFEDLVRGVQAVCRRLGLYFDPDRLPRFKTGLRDHSIALGDYYPPGLRERVAEVFAPELQAFGYAPPGA